MLQVLNLKDAAAKSDNRTRARLVEIGREYGLFAVHALTMPASSLGAAEQAFQVLMLPDTALTDDLARQVGSAEATLSDTLRAKLMCNWPMTAYALLHAAAYQDPTYRLTDFLEAAERQELPPCRLSEAFSYAGACRIPG